MFPERPVTLPERVNNHRPARQNQADQPLGEYCQGAGCPGQQHPVAEGGRFVAAALGQGQGADRQDQKGRHRHVQGNDMAHGHKKWIVQGDDKGPESRLGSIEATAGKPDEEGAEKAGEGRPEPGGGIVDPEQLKAGRRCPVLQGGLFEILKTVQARGQPVAAGHHLPGDLGIAALVRVDQVAVAEERKPAQGGQHCGDDHGLSGHWVRILYGDEVSRNARFRGGRPCTC